MIRYIKLDNTNPLLSNYLACDTETYKDMDNKGNCLYTSIAYAGFVSPVNGKIKVVHSADEFIDFMVEISKWMKDTINKDLHLAFYNIKFDMSHIKHAIDADNKYNIQVESIISAKKTLIAINYTFSTGNIGTKSYRKYKIKCFDIARKIPSGTLYDNYKAFGGKNFNKGNTPIYTNGKPSIITSQEYDYLDNDLGMTAYLLIKTQELGSKLTSSSDALEEYKTMFAIDNNIKSTNTMKQTRNKYRTNKFEDEWNKVFWPAYNKDMKSFKEWKQINEVQGIDNPFDWINNSYKGGITQVNPYHQHMVIPNIYSYDINSAYPDAMYNNKMPIGKPTYSKGKPPFKHNKVYIIQITVYAAKLKNNHTPFLSKSRNMLYGSYSYMKDIFELEGLSFTMTQPEYDLFKQCYYDIDYKYVDYMEFDYSTTLFKSYIDKWINIKNEATIKLKDKSLSQDGVSYWLTQRMNAKLKLNQLYGKLGSNVNLDEYIYETNHEGILCMNINNKVKNYNFNSYVHMAAFITAYVRNKLISTCNKIGWMNIVYMDTDAFYVKNVDKQQAVNYGINIHSSNLGSWDLETNNYYGKFLQTKCYILADNEYGYDNKNRKVKIAGLSSRLVSSITDFNMFSYGMLIHGNLKAKQVKGGVSLEQTTFSIN